MSSKDIISNFIQSERDRFETRHNNIFSFSFSSIITYLEYLEIIFDRYQKSSSDTIINSKLIRESFAGTNGPIPKEHLLLLEENRRISRGLHLEIESFYLFSKILLDKVTQAIEYYFGPLRSYSLDSHDDFTKNIQKYAEAKNLNINSEFVALVEKCKLLISDYRDKNVSHEKSPRTMKGTSYSLETGKTKMFLNRIYPKDTEEQTESIPLDELFSLIDEYIDALIEFLNANLDKTSLKIEHKPDLEV